MNKQINISTAIVLIVAVAIITGMVAWALKGNNAMAPTSETAISKLPSAGTSAQSQTDLLTPEKAAQSAGAADANLNKYDGWETYTSDKYGYSIKYPPETIIVEAKKNDFGLPAGSKMTFDQAYAKYTGQICVSFDTKKGHVLISAPPNKEFAYVICGRTGVGSEDKIKNYTDEVTIDGKKYTAKVQEITGPEGKSVETYVELSDGTQLIFSGSSNANSEEIKKMVESFTQVK